MSPSETETLRAEENEHAVSLCTSAPRLTHPALPPHLVLEPCVSPRSHCSPPRARPWPHLSKLSLVLMKKSSFCFAYSITSG